jgi:hypothetical protein
MSNTFIGGIARSKALRKSLFFSILFADLFHFRALAEKGSMAVSLQAIHWSIIQGIAPVRLFNLSSKCLPICCDQGELLRPMHCLVQRVFICCYVEECVVSAALTPIIITSISTPKSSASYNIPIGIDIKFHSLLSFILLSFSQNPY